MFLMRVKHGLPLAIRSYSLGASRKRRGTKLFLIATLFVVLPSAAIVVDALRLSGVRWRSAGMSQWRWVITGLVSMLLPGLGIAVFAYYLVIARPKVTGHAFELDSDDVADELQAVALRLVDGSALAVGIFRANTFPWTGWYPFRSEPRALELSLKAKTLWIVTADRLAIRRVKLGASIDGLTVSPGKSLGEWPRDDLIATRVEKKDWHQLSRPQTKLCGGGHLPKR